MTVSQLPNLLTVLRMLLVAPFVYFLFRENYGVALTLLFLAGLTDMLDGFLARRYQWFSWFGSVADPVADKLLLISTYVVLGFLGHFPLWLVVIVVGRDILIFSASLTYWLIAGEFEGQPTFLGKSCTFFMVVQGLLMLVALAIMPIPEIILEWGNWIVVVLCLASAIHYVVLGVEAFHRLSQKGGSSS